MNVTTILCVTYLHIIPIYTHTYTLYPYIHIFTHYSHIYPYLHTIPITYTHLHTIPIHTHTYTLFLYIQVAGRLKEFRDLVKEVVRSACRTALLEAGFTPDDYFYSESPVNNTSETPGGASSYYMQDMDMDIYGEAPDKMNFYS